MIVTEIAVCYTGIGSKKCGGLHTREEFMEIMKNKFIKTDVYYKIHGASHDPEVLKNYTFKEWIDWSGANLVEIHKTVDFQLIQ